MEDIISSCTDRLTGINALLSLKGETIADIEIYNPEKENVGFRLITASGRKITVTATTEDCGDMTVLDVY